MHFYPWHLSVIRLRLVRACAADDQLMLARREEDTSVGALVRSEQTNTKRAKSSRGTESDRDWRWGAWRFYY